MPPLDAEANPFDQFDPPAETPEHKVETAKEENPFDKFDPVEGGVGPFMSRAGRGAAQSAITSTGQALEGVPEMANRRPYWAPYFQAYQNFNKLPLNKREEVRRQIASDEHLTANDKQELNARLSDVAEGNELPSTFEKFAGELPTESPLYKAGHAVEKFGESAVPISPAEKEQFSTQMGSMAGPVPAAILATIAGGPAAGAALFASQTAAQEAAQARAAGATEQQITAAAQKGAVVGGVAGSADLGAVLAPVERAGPGFLNWATAKLNHALRAGVTFPTVGEAQTWLSTQIQKDYDPSAHYDFDPQRAAAALVAGAAIGGGHSLIHADPMRPGLTREDFTGEQPPPAAPAEPSLPAGPAAPSGGVVWTSRPGRDGYERIEEALDPATNQITEYGVKGALMERLGQRPAGPETPPAAGEGVPGASNPEAPAATAEPAATTPQATLKDIAAGKEAPDAPAVPTAPGGQPPPPAGGAARPGRSKTVGTAIDKLNESLEDMRGKPAAAEEAPATPKKDAAPSFLPPVPKGYVRMYSSAGTEANGSRWATPDFNYAKNAGGSGGGVDYVDVPTNHPSLVETTGTTGMPGDVEPQFLSNSKLSSDLAEKMQPVLPDVRVVDKTEAAKTWDEARARGEVPNVRVIDSPKAKIDQAAAETAEPTEGQKTAGNYKKGRIDLADYGMPGFKGAVETPEGTLRTGTDPETGQSWEATAPEHYGYINKTLGADGDHVDAYFGPNPESGKAFVVDQADLKTGKFDEHKVMLGFNDREEALNAYVSGFSDGRGPERIGGSRQMSMDELGTWLKGDTTKPVSMATEPEAPAVPKPAEIEKAPLANPITGEADNRHPSLRVADFVAGHLEASDGRLTTKELLQEAERLHGGSMSEGKFDRKDLYDAVELGVNQYIREHAEDFNPRVDSLDEAKSIIRDLGEIKYRLPTQTVRSDEMISHQQFSTPPDYAYAVNWLANIKPGESVVEPSAGTGGIAVHAMNAGAKVHVNELSDRRADLVESLNPASATRENADNLHNILPEEIKPTVVVMNPPFSQTAGRMGDKKVTTVGADHVEQGLQRLEPGGRLVAIVGRGMAPNAARFKDWWNRIAKEYNVRANVGVDGDVYKKYGTSFDTRVLVIDKIPPTGDKPVTGEVKTIGDLVSTLERVRNDRPEPKRGEDRAPTGEPVGTESARPEVAPGSEGAGRPDGTVSDPARESGDGQGRPGAGSGEQLPGRPGDGDRPAAESPAGRDEGKPLAGEQPGGSEPRGAGRDTDREPTGSEDVGDRGPGGAGDDLRSAGSGKPALRPGDSPSGLSDRAFDDLLGKALDDEFKEPEKTTGAADERTAGEVARDAGESAVKGLDKVAAGLHELFGDPTRLGAGPTFDPALYEKAKPLFKQGLEHFSEAAKDVGELIKRLVQALHRQFGMAREAIERMAPYLRRFAQDVESGQVELDKSKAPGEPKEVVPTETVNVDEAAVGPHGGEITDAVYEPYKPQRISIEGAKEHPGELVQSSAMASVLPPKPDYQTKIPKKLIEAGALSEAQLEPIVYAGQAHAQMLPHMPGEKPVRRGYFIGDGTGVGKGREVAGIILDNWMQGRKKAVWISEKKPLMNDAKRDWQGLGQDPGDIFDLGKTKSDSSIKAKQGILFSTYDTLKGSQKLGKDKVTGKPIKGKTRIDQIVDFLGKDYDGVIAFDEAHNMANSIEQKGSRGMKDASAKALAGIELQDKMPNARVVYVSATGATEVSNLAYAQRLGLWGRGTAFATKSDFITKVSSGGIAAMELVARDMKAMGHYIARSLSYNGVEYNRLEHDLTPDQKQTYDKMAEGWQVVLNNINAALEKTGADKNANAKSKAMSAFWGGHQRFFNQVITSIQMPTVLKGIEGDLKEGRQAVLQLVNTNEAAQERALAGVEHESELEDLDMSPKSQLMELVKRSFPVAQHEEYVDDNGNLRSRPVTTKDGSIVENKQAVAMREKLLDDLEGLRVPDGPLEMLMNHFGIDKVAEVTGRGQRVVLKPDEKTGEMRTQVEPRPASANTAEADLFQAGKKPILVFSQAGGTGRSYHAEKSAPSAGARRSHYLVQAGWRADAAIQGFGRTHRTNQESAPIFHLVTTDLKGQKRFISSIARRLSQLGALTKGERRTGDQGLFSARDNLESREANEGLVAFFQDLHEGKIPDMTMAEIEQQMGLKLIDPDTGALTKNLPEIPKFLNRLLSLKFDMQNKVFDAFDARLGEAIDRAAASGALDSGVETLKADRISKAEQRPVYKDPQSGAETQYVRLNVENRNPKVSFDEIADGGGRLNGKQPIGFVRSKGSGRVYALGESRAQTDTKTGRISEQYRLVDNLKYDYIDKHKIDGYDADRYWEKLDPQNARQAWEEQLGRTPEYSSRDVHLITGAVLPIWDRLSGSPKVYRLQTADGERMLGRVIQEKDLGATLKALGAENSAKHDPATVAARILDGGTATLSNGWRIKRSLVANEPRIEVVGPGFNDREMMKGEGLFSERIDARTRYFVPTDEKAAEVIGNVTKYRPISDMISGKEGDEQYMRRGPGGDEPLAVARARDDVKRGAQAMIDRMRMQANLDEAHNRRVGVQGGKERAPLDRDEAREVEDFIGFIGHRMFDDVGMRIMNGPAGVQGAYSFGNKLVSIFRSAIQAGNLPHAAVHELWHHLSTFMPHDDAVAVTKEYQRQRTDWLKKNDWVKPFVENDLRMKDKLTGQAARDFLDKHEHDQSVMRRVTVGGDEEKPTVSMGWDDETYRYRDPDEYFAETMADKYFDHRNLQDQKAASVLGHARDLWQRMVNGVKRLFGRDVTGRVFDGFKNGQYRTPEEADVGVARDAAYMKRRTEEQIRSDQQEADERAATWAKRMKAPMRALMETAPMKRLTNGSIYNGLKTGLAEIGRGIQMFTSPITAGSDRARAVSKKFANDMRWVQYQYSQLDRMITRLYSAKEREAMGRALDEQSVMDQEGVEDPDRGLGRLSDDQRATVEQLNEMSKKTWDRLYEAGIVRAEEGLPYYMPRMFVRALNEAGILKPVGKPENPKLPALDPIGTNLITGGPMRRQHLTAEESLKAAQAKFGANTELVTDIRALLLALNRSERAIAGKRLIDSVKQMGRDVGMDTVRDSAGQGFFTVDHPAFKTWSPNTVSDGKGGFKIDLREDGSPVMVKKDLYVAREFEGPLRSVLNKPPNVLYKALMHIKSAAMSMIMFSPLIHNMVEFGRAFPLLKAGIFKAYFDGNRVRNIYDKEGNLIPENYETMKRATDAGFSPIGNKWLSDISGVASEPSIMPGRSILAKLAGETAGLVGGRKANLATRRGIDAFGKFWHETLLWDRIADLQAGIYVNKEKAFLAEGYPPEAAAVMAAHLANRYAGALPQESMSHAARAVANITMFSRSFTLGNLGVMKDMINGMPRDVRAKLERDLDGLMMRSAQSTARRKAIGAFMVDMAIFYGMNSVAQNAFSMWNGEQDASDVGAGYVRRAKNLGSHLADHPLNVINPFDMVNRLTPMSEENEEKKEDRIKYGTDERGRALYVRNIFGKFPEELAGWWTKPITMAKQKSSTIVKPTMEILNNEDFFKHPIYDSDAKTFEQNLGAARDIVTHLMKAQTPWSTIEGAIHVMQGGPGEGVEAAKVLLPLAGITFSEGDPAGPAAGYERAVNKKADDAYYKAKPEINRMIKRGDTLEAKRILVEEFHQTTKEADRVIQNQLHPQRQTKAIEKKFERIATPEQRERRESLGR